LGAIKPIDNDHPAEWHSRMFTQFGAAKDVIGEPTPHMRVVDYMCRDVSDAEASWRAGCYLTAYSVLTGEGIWNSWSWERIRAEPKAFLPWLEANWAGVHTRKPRRCVRTPRQFNESLLSWADWAATELPRLTEKSATYYDKAYAARAGDEAEQHLVRQAEYDEWWKSANDIRYYGRYIAIRVLELMRRRGKTKAELYDIRAVGAHSPIRCLMLLRPDRVDELMTGNPRVVDSIAREVKEELRLAGIDMSFFIFATLLCEYRSGYEGGGDYAGNQHDEELEYSLSRYADYWAATGLKSQLYEARAAIDPHSCLGEIEGWNKRRLDVAGWMRQRGVVWNDTLYDYHKSIAADAPVARV
jgi:hypothetical protein